MDLPQVQQLELSYRIASREFKTWFLKFAENKKLTISEQLKMLAEEVHDLSDLNLRIQRDAERIDAVSGEKK